MSDVVYDGEGLTIAHPTEAEAAAMFMTLSAYHQTLIKSQSSCKRRVTDGFKYSEDPCCGTLPELVIYRRIYFLPPFTVLLHV